MHRQLLLLIISLPIFVSGQEINFTISGKVLGQDGSNTLYLTVDGLRDSINLQNNKPFYYSGKAKNPCSALLRAKNTSMTSASIWLTNGSIKIELEEIKVSDQNNTTYKLLNIISLDGPDETLAWQNLNETLSSIISENPKNNILSADSSMLQFYPPVKDYVQKFKDSFSSADVANLYQFPLNEEKELYSILKDNPDKENVNRLRSKIERLELPQRGQEINFTISGKIFGQDGSNTLYLTYLTAEGLRDSIELQNNKPFSYSGKVKKPCGVLLITKNTSYNAFIWLTNGPIKIELEEYLEPGQKQNNLRYLKILSLSGADESVAYQNLLKALDSISSKKPHIDILGIDSLTLQYYPFVKDYVQKYKNSSSPFEEIISNSFTLDEKKELYSIIKDNPDTESVNVLRNQIERLELTQRGKKIDNFTQPTPEGKTVELYSLKDRLILIQFWYSGCFPCRWEHPDLIKLYTKYHSRGFEILAISLDDNTSDWKQAIEKDHLPWINVSDLLAWKNPIVKKYKIDHMPFNILVDSSYSVIATELWPPQLKEVLNRIIGE